MHQQPLQSVLKDSRHAAVRACGICLRIHSFCQKYSSSTSFSYTSCALQVSVVSVCASVCMCRGEKGREFAVNQMKADLLRFHDSTV